VNHIATRSLAASAVSALLLTGLSLGSAPDAQAAGPAVRLLSQHTGLASVRVAGTDPNTGVGQSGIRLTAQVQGGGASFEVNADPEATDDATGWTPLELSLVSGPPYVSAFWNGQLPDGRSLVGERVAIRAVSVGPDGTSYSTRRDVEVTGEESATEAVHISTSTARYFAQPYADTGRTKSLLRVNGGTSATDGTVKLSAWRSSTGQFAGTVAAQVEPDSFKAPGSPVLVPGGRFTGVLDITGFDAASGTVAVSAVRDSDDVASIAVSQQQIAVVDAYSNGSVPQGARGRVTVQVLDADSFPVLGAEVRRDGSGELVGYTDANGRVETTQPGGESSRYYANATDADAYASTDGDQVSDPVVVQTYAPEATYASPVLRDGRLFDLDEYAPGDIGVQVRDQNGEAVGAGTSVSYKLYPASDDAPDAYRTVTTDADGFAAVPLTEVAGTYKLATRLTAAPADQEEDVVTFTTGEATLSLSPRADPAPADPGGQIDYVGRLELAGQPLARRRVDLSYRRGVEVVPGNTADAALLVGDKRTLATTATTNSNGTFRVTVDDLAETVKATETGGVLTAATGATVATDDDPFDGDADASRTSGTRFGTAGPGKAAIALAGTSNGSAADVLKVTGPTSVAGEQVQVFRFASGGKRVLVTTKRLGSTGDLTLKVSDRNKAAATTYVVRLVASKRVRAADSNRKAIG
jgi:hypothetical protein